LPDEGGHVTSHRSGQLNTIVESTQNFEAWLAQRTRVVAPDLKFKHDQMAADSFAFMRATFYRWIQRWHIDCPAAARSPTVLAIGDLHLQNFGTWRDAEGRLIWGVNDFDEAWPLPYLQDLIRLATSVRLVIARGSLEFPIRDACSLLLEGYRERLEEGGLPFVLGEQHRTLRRLALGGLKDPVVFWQKLSGEPVVRRAEMKEILPLLRRALPDRDLVPSIHFRRSGLGSLGRQRFVALALWRGGLVAREAKALVPGAVSWATNSSPRSYAAKLAKEAVRVPDPFLHFASKWIVRRLAPDCSRIELSGLPNKSDADRVLYSMGAETANVHLPTATRAVKRDLATRTPRWLHSQVEVMAAAVLEDWKKWRNRK
jgi:hypothetical protein